MKTKESSEVEKIEETPDSWWYKVYLAVVITTVAVIAALWLFTKTFS